MTVTIRNHMLGEHKDEYTKLVLDQQLKGWELIAYGTNARSVRKYSDFTKDGFEDRVVKYVICNDRVRVIYPTVAVNHSSLHALSLWTQSMIFIFGTYLAIRLLARWAKTR